MSIYLTYLYLCTALLVFAQEEDEPFAGGFDLSAEESEPTANDEGEFADGLGAEDGFSLGSGGEGDPDVGFEGFGGDFGTAGDSDPLI